jgi:hypothetical protein
MHSFLSKKLRKSFDAAMKRTFPDFEKYVDPDWPKLPVYRLPIEDRGSLFVSLEIDKHNNAYTIELAWAPPGEAPWNGTLEFDLADMRGRLSRARPSSTDNRSEYYWNVVTGGEGLRADRANEPFTVEAMLRSAATKPDPNMEEHIDACVADTMRLLQDLVPGLTERARENLGGPATA